MKINNHILMIDNTMYASEKLAILLVKSHDYLVSYKFAHTKYSVSYNYDMCKCSIYLQYSSGRGYAVCGTSGSHGFDNFGTHSKKYTIDLRVQKKCNKLILSLYEKSNLNRLGKIKKLMGNVQHK